MVAKRAATQVAAGARLSRRSAGESHTHSECAALAWEEAGKELGRDCEWRSAAERPLRRRGRRLGPSVLGVRSRRQREHDAEDGAAPEPRAVADGASVSLDHRANDRQPEPDTALAPRPRTVGAVETLEDPVRLSGRHAGARVGDLEHNLLV